jgi:hypothetical protein
MHVSDRYQMHAWVSGTPWKHSLWPRYQMHVDKTREIRRYPQRATRCTYYFGLPIAKALCSTTR